MEKASKNDSAMLLVSLYVYWHSPLSSDQLQLKHWHNLWFPGEEQTCHLQELAIQWGGGKRLYTCQVQPILCFKCRVKWCLPRMAEAGFYACGGDNEPDLARCYFCRFSPSKLSFFFSFGHSLKAHSSGKSLMGGILRMTPGLSMCPMQRLILGSFVSSWHSCFSGEMCLCQPGKESKWTDSSWCECNWRITSYFCLAWLSSLISSGLGRTRASQEQNGAYKGTNLPDFFMFEKLCHDFIKYC